MSYSQDEETLSTSRGWSHNNVVVATYISSAAFIDAVAAVRSVTTATANYYNCSAAALSSPGPSGTSPLNRPPRQWLTTPSDGRGFVSRDVPIAAELSSGASRRRPAARFYEQ